VSAAFIAYKVLRLTLLKRTHSASVARAIQTDTLLSVLKTKSSLENRQNRLTRRRSMLNARTNAVSNAAATTTV
jgi:hypothetical protein